MTKKLLHKLVLTGVACTFPLTVTGVVQAENSEDYTRENTETYNDWIRVKLNPGNDSGKRVYNFPANTILGWDGYLYVEDHLSHYGVIRVVNDYTYIDADGKSHSNNTNEEFEINSPNTLKIIIRYPKKSEHGKKRLIKHPWILDYNKNIPLEQDIPRETTITNSASIDNASGILFHSEVSNKPYLTFLNMNAPLFIDVQSISKQIRKATFGYQGLVGGIAVVSNSGKTGGGKSILNLNEDTEINVHNVLNSQNKTINNWGAYAFGITGTSNIYKSDACNCYYEIVAKKNLKINMDADSDVGQNMGLYMQDLKTNSKSLISLQGNKVEINVGNKQNSFGAGVYMFIAGNSQQRLESSKNTDFKLHANTVKGDNAGITLREYVGDIDSSGSIRELDLAGKNTIITESHGPLLIGKYYYGDVKGLYVNNVTGTNKIHFGGKTLLRSINDNEREDLVTYGILSKSKDNGKVELTADDTFKIDNTGSDKVGTNQGIVIKANGNNDGTKKSTQIMNFNGLVSIDGVREAAEVSSANGSIAKLNFNGGIEVNSTIKEPNEVIEVDGSGAELNVNTTDKDGEPKGGNVILSGSIGAYNAGKTDIRVLTKDSKVNLTYRGDKNSTHNFTVSGEGSVLTATKEHDHIVEQEDHSKVDLGKVTLNGTVENNGTFKPYAYKEYNGTLHPMEINKLTLNSGGTLDLSSDDNNAKQRIDIDKLTGKEGRVLLGIDASKQDVTDLLVINKFTGKHKIALKELGHGDLNGALDTTLALVKEGDGVFEAENGKGTLYYRRYDLAKRDVVEKDKTKDIVADKGSKQEWYLAKATNIAPEEEATPTMSVLGGISNYSLNSLYDVNDTLTQRLGELRNNVDKDNNLWFRTSYGKYSKDNTFGFTSKNHKYELGYDKLISSTDNLKRYRGVSLQRINSNLDLAHHGMDNRLSSVSLYQVDTRPNGSYLDGILRFGSHRFDKSLKLDDKTLNFDNASPNFWTASVEYGHRLNKDKGLYIEPQAQMIYSHVQGLNYNIKDADDHLYLAGQKGINSLVGRVGVEAGKVFSNKEKGYTGKFYAKLNVLHEFAGNNNWWAVDTDPNGEKPFSYKGNNHQTWYKYGIGTSYQGPNNTAYYADVEKIAGGHYSGSWKWNAGVRYSF